MADTGDKITDVRNAARPNSARALGSRSAGGTTLACDSLAGWPTASKVHFVTYQLDSNSQPSAGSQLDCYGIVSGNSIGSITVVDGTDAGNAIGDVVEMLPTAAWGQDLADALTAEHSRTGVHALTSSSTITSSKLITSLNDTSGNEIFKVSPTSSAINEFTFTNAAVGTNPTFAASGGDTNISADLRGKGTGGVRLELRTQKDDSNSITSATTPSIRMQTGWVQIEGDGSSSITSSVTFPTAFSTPLNVVAGWIGQKSSVAADITAVTSAMTDGGTLSARSISTTGFVMAMNRDTGTFASGSYYVASWIAFGT